MKTNLFYFKLRKFSYPDPLPPTTAIFFPDGTVKDKFSNISRPGTYSKYTFLNVMADSSKETSRFGALDWFCRKK